MELLEILEKGRKDVPFSVQTLSTSINHLTTSMSTFATTMNTLNQISMTIANTSTATVWNGGTYA